MASVFVAPGLAIRPRLTEVTWPCQSNNFFANIADFLEIFGAVLRLISMSTAAHPSELIAPGQAPLPQAEELPDDTDTLKKMIVELVISVRQRDHDLGEARQRIHLLLQKLYGRRSERYHPDQPLLFPDDADAAMAPPVDQATMPDQAAADQETPAGQRRQRRHGRRRLPDNLPRRVVHHELSAAERICVCGAIRVDIGADSGGEQLDWQPASYFAQ